MEEEEELEAAVEVNNVHTHFGEKVVHRGVSFRTYKRQVSALIGSSGTGKSVLLREIIGLMRPAAGSIHVLGTDVWDCTPEELTKLRTRFGVLFQDGALFSNLSVGENVAAPLEEQMDLPEEIICRLVDLRLALSGLSVEDRHKMPSELSGGMRKRAALARALSLEPEVLFLDEPTSGLDPITARKFDELVSTLSHNLGIAVLLTTHDLDTIEGIVDHLIVLDGGKVLAQGPVAEVKTVEHPWVQEYFSARPTIRD